ncbi:MAG: sigma-54-dependent transcriptional regulator [Aestuariivirga sp.]
MQLEGRVIGLVEDDPVMGESLVQSLSLEGCHVDWWKTRAEAQRGLRATSPDLVVCDMRLPDGRGDDLFFELATTESLPPFLFVTAYGDIDQAVAVMRAGAGDYLTKPFEMGAFLDRARMLIQRNAIARADAVLGVSEDMRSIESTLRRVSDGTSPVLISGETGVGKEVCARFLHGVSVRSKEPFIAVNCAAIPADVMERELFGYRGVSGQAFHHGFAERARSGILFLDEVSELPLALQAKLLRLVEAREYHRVGGEQQMQFRGRIVCSSNRDLERLVAKGEFRTDLFFRINAVTVQVPPLRQRADDIPWLIEHFLSRFQGTDRTEQRSMSTLTLEMALEHPWPGNVRELRNRVERAASLANTEWIMPIDMFPDRATTVDHPMMRAFATLSETRDFAERRQIERALKETGGQILEAARLLGVSRTTLWDKMRRLNVSGDMD